MSDNLGQLIKQRRLSRLLTLRELSAVSGVSTSHLGRIEKGERFPSAYVLRKVAQPLGFEEGELFTLAGYLSAQTLGIAEEEPEYSGKQLDPYVASLLAQEPVELQRAVIGILAILKNLARGMPQESDKDKR